jgi:membrane-bound serine protease (ClpP class)
MMYQQGTARSVLLVVLLFSSIILLGAQDSTGSAVVYVIPIHGEIDTARMVFVRRGIQKAERDGAELVVFDIDTFGGAVDAALQIATLIGSVRDARTVAFVSSGAEGTGVSWSAGALISLACEVIYMAPGTSIGAAAPVYQTQAGMEAAPEKTVSAVRAQMAALAEKNGYPASVARAMVDLDVELVEVYVGEELRLIARDEYPQIEREAERLGVEIEEGKIISASGKLLALTAGEMEYYRISSGTVGTLEALLVAEDLAPVVTQILEETPFDRAAAWVTGAAVTGLLILAGLVALYLEITSPGFGVPGTIAIICFAVVFLGGALLGTIGSLELLLFLSGVVLLVVEIFLIPGFGVTGISGIILMGTALVLSRQSFVWPEFTWEWEQFRRNIAVVGVSFFSSIVVFGLLVRSFPKLPFFNRLILSSPSVAVLPSSDGGGAGLVGDAPVPVGSIGVVRTALRPVGKAVFDGEVREVQSDGEFLPVGTTVEVTEAKGNRLFVRRRGIS